ncbi:hypothetical protein BDFG_04532 [Blastomyces dermatitidis ATCC 26199]|nr:hypothetical protein BDFG_04532 [Blastomyces dermatitidis ATCC 26199]
MKRSIDRRDHDHRRAQDQKSDSESSYSDLHGRSEAPLETDLTEPDVPERPAKRPNSDEGDFSNDPLDDTGVDLSAIPEDYGKSAGTLLRRGCIEKRWLQYCKVKARQLPDERKWHNPKRALCEASDNDIHRFLGWCLKLKRGKDGRHLKGIHKASSFKGDWRSFRLYYERVTKNKIRDEDGSNVRRRIKYLIDTNGLDTMQYKDLQFSLQKDPHGGPPIPLVELTAQGVKKFMGEIKLITFPLPEVIYGPSLIFYPHTYLFGMLFHAKAFQAPGLTSMAELRKLFVKRGCQQMPLYLKRETADWYVFCKTEVVKGTPVIRRRQPLFKHMMGRLLSIFGEIHGWLHSMFSHRFRYGSGKILNESGWVSEEQRMLIMKHADRRTFIDHYHPRTVGTEMIRTICGLDPDKEMMRSVARLDRWRDQRRSRHLTTEDKKRMKDHPELVTARQKLETITAEYHQTRNPDFPARIRRQERESLLDIEAQLLGTMADESEESLSSEDNMHLSLLGLLQKLLSYPISDSLEAEWQCHNEAVDYVVLYCDTSEEGPLRGRLKKNLKKTQPPAGNSGPYDDPHSKDDSEKKKHLLSHDELLRLTTEHIEKAPKPRACFQCFSDRKLPDEVRCRMFYDPGCLTKHYDSHHLQDEQCNWCELSVLQIQCIRSIMPRMFIIRIPIFIHHCDFHSWQWLISY